MAGSSPELAFSWVPGREPALVFIHGLGADGRCFLGALDAPGLKGRAMLVPDLAGFGNSPRLDPFPYTMEAQSELLGELCRSVGSSKIAIIAHSMGGPVGIVLAENWHGTVTHFASAVGNLVPQDCFFSRTIVEMGYLDFEREGFEKFKAEIQQQGRPPGRPQSTYPQSLQRTSAHVMFHSSRHLVSISDEGDLVSRFLRLPCKKKYLHDEDSRMPSQLESSLRQGGVPVVRIPDSGHGLMEDNPIAFYDAIARFLEE